MWSNGSRSVIDLRIWDKMRYFVLCLCLFIFFESKHLFLVAADLPKVQVSKQWWHQLCFILARDRHRWAAAAEIYCFLVFFFFFFFLCSDQWKNRFTPDGKFPVRKYNKEPTHGFVPMTITHTLSTSLEPIPGGLLCWIILIYVSFEFINLWNVTQTHLFVLPLSGLSNHFLIRLHRQDVEHVRGRIRRSSSHDNHPSSWCHFAPPPPARPHRIVGENPRSYSPQSCPCKSNWLFF